jgi:hypothetical protein
MPVRKYISVNITTLTSIVGIQRKKCTVTLRYLRMAIALQSSLSLTLHCIYIVDQLVTYVLKVTTVRKQTNDSNKYKFYSCGSFFNSFISNQNYEYLDSIS